MLRLVFFAILLLLYGSKTNAIDGSKFISAEGMAGKIVPNFLNYPGSDIRNTFTLGTGMWQTDTSARWRSYFGFPLSSFEVSFSRLGNDAIFGYEWSAMPVVSFFGRPGNPLSWRYTFGLGASYITRHYVPKDNEQNEAIGSSLTWNFKAFLYKGFRVGHRGFYSLGAGYLHSSNGHMQLPNYGLNSALISLQYFWFSRGFRPSSANLQTAKTRPAKVVQLRQGVGMHALGNAGGPVDSPRKPVYTTAISVGWIFRQSIKLNTGFAYRYYQHYYDYISENQVAGYADRPNESASCVYFLLGCELLLGHVSMDIAGGLNIFKPFYKTFYDTFERGGNTDYWLKRLFNTRLGLNVYLFDPAIVRNNFFTGAHINANFGQADFSEISVGYSYRW